MSINGKSAKIVSLLAAFTTRHFFLGMAIHAKKNIDKGGNESI